MKPLITSIVFVATFIASVVFSCKKEGIINPSPAPKPDTKQQYPILSYY
jgi:hypothetical protein